ncbi:MAG: glucosaminidase domain-containing protein [Roseburia sp.]|nr:glucosaminidase domain-containing protein [Roseburia sp.]
MTKILGQAEAAAEQMAAYLLSVNPSPQTSVPPLELCRAFLEQAAKEGVRGDALFAQSCKETGNFAFRGTVKPGQNNFAGLGTTDPATPGASFPDADTGILAQAQHAKAYATAAGLACPCVDPRYGLLVKYGKAGTAPHWEELGGRWAVPGYDTKKYPSLEEADAAGDSYGYQIIRILQKILAMPVEEERKEPTMIKKTAYQTKNRAYTSGRTISVAGAMLHSYGCPQPDPNVLAERWNNSAASACVHAHIGKELCIETLPCAEQKGKARRGWHSGSGKKGSANNTHISAEMTEPATIKYVGGSNWIELGDGSNTKAHVLATYKNAVEEFAQWCKYHGLNPLADGVILSHREGCARGIASNHGDVEHIWAKFGLTMDQFRRDVAAAMQGNVVDFGGMVAVTDTSGQKISPLDGTLTVIYGGEDGLNIREAPSYNAPVQDVAYKNVVFTVTGISADEKWYQLKGSGFVSAVPSYVSFKATPAQKEATAGTGYYRVRQAWDKPDTQIGAFKVQENAIELCLQNSGYRVYDPDGKEIYPCTEAQAVPMQAAVKISNLRIRKGPGTTYDYHKKGGQAVYTGKKTVTIVETSDGPGAKLWGLLGDYTQERNGWIALDDAYVDIRK